MSKSLPFTIETIRQIEKNNPTPFYIYDESGMIEQAKGLQSAFAWNPGFKEYYAVKAAPNPYLLKILHSLGFGMDCSSLAELELCAMLGISGDDIMFTSNNTPAKEYSRAKELGAIINLDDLTHIDFVEATVGLPELICFRFNPGPERLGSDIIGNPEEAKFGFTRAQLFEGYKLAKAKGVKRFGLHTMPISNQLEPKYFVETVAALLSLVKEIEAQIGIKIEFINMGGGIGIPYRPEQSVFPIAQLGQSIQELFAEHGRTDLKLMMECGRYITGPFGYLVTTAIHFKDIYRQYVGIDATMANLMRPALYGSYHHISVMGKEGLEPTEVYDVVGSLCENNDKFAIARKLPKIERGDIVVLHDAGAHGHAMGFNYNGKLRSAEFLLRPNGETLLIRRAETLTDHFATLNLDGLGKFKALAN